ncbi:DEAD/DEAH box helicase [Nocardioides salsibiostraticola]
MSGNINAVGTATDIKDTYRRYLRSLLAVRDPAIAQALTTAIDESPMLDKGPYLEATPPYANGRTLRQLIDDGVMAPGFAGLDSAALPLDRPLYTHQERSIRKVSEGRNVIVATGTGSGKTESFLLPILDSLVREQAERGLDPGVRALLLYPMNALANDQMKRLRQVLANYPAITFGRYTGDTAQDPKKARERFQDLNIGEPMLPNELLSREEMRQAPPHLLLTNYAMLEYLLIRPLDLDLFGSQDRDRWRFIVVDEAHVYDGTQGAEIGMLLRRVRDRVAPDRNLQCIATSATVGGDTNPDEVTKFASNLFGETFEWVEGDPQRQDLILAERQASPSERLWGPLSSEDYTSLAAAGDPEQAITAAATRAGFSVADAATALLHERSVVTLRQVLSGLPLGFDIVAAKVFPGEATAREGLAALVDLASTFTAHDGTTALSARYHLFLRATEGAFTCLSPQGPHVHLARHDSCAECAAPAFEMGSCKRCAAVHLIGQVQAEGGHYRLRPRKPTGGNTWLVLGDQRGEIDEDEEAVTDETTDLDGDEGVLCTACGALGPAGVSSCPDKACGSTAVRPVRRLKKRGEEIAGCVVCGARGSGTVRIFETGPDASGAVITTSLYQNLPTSDQPAEAALPGAGRKLLMFSDSRQAAAYFAPYLEDSYGKLQQRRLMVQGLAKAGATHSPASVEDVVFQTRAAADAVQQFPWKLTAQDKARRVAPWVMAEALATDDRQSLEGLGLVRIDLARDPAWPAPPPLLALGLTGEEAWSFVSELLRTLRQQGAMTMPDEVPPDHEIFKPRLGPIRARETGPEAVKKVLSWLPGKGTNKRIAYTKRVLASLNSDADPHELLRGVWKFLTAEQSPVEWLERTTHKALGTTYQIDHRLLRFRWVSPDEPVYRCDRCRRVAPVSVRGVCPALACHGELQVLAIVPPEEETDHYRAVYQSMYPVPLSALEHTAQWSTERAGEIQHQFIKGEVNALSCSTTFELGVDVGELQAVFLRNMPPTTANYVQRAGRAGRRAGAAALVVTYAQRRSHDLTRYAEPEIMMAGSIRSPYVPLTNERIDRRHAYSVALSAFFRSHFETTGQICRSAADFFLPGDNGSEPVVDLIEGYLTPVPAGITASLMRILPLEVHSAIGVEDGGWVLGFKDLLDKVKAQLSEDVKLLADLRDQAAEGKKYQLAERYQKVSKTLEKRDLLGYLANHNLLPKYGFPVDSVELRTAYSDESHGVGQLLDLSRDLAQAIFEYAPGATLVAGGKLWTSRGIYRLPGRDLVEYEYRVCSRCSGFWHALAGLSGDCPHCQEPNTGVARRLTVPEYGFVAAKETARPGPRPPRRSFSGAVHVLKPSPEVREGVVTRPGGTVRTHVGPRGTMIAVADGPSGMGYWICQWCGHGASRMEHAKKPPKHDHPMRHTACHGPADLLDLAHSYETDLLTLEIEVPGLPTTQDAWKAVVYALLEAACETLELARDDIGGTLSPTGENAWSLVLYDSVPGGAGHVLMVEANLERVIEAALKRVENCECGPETSCYACLRSYSNQRDHDVLSRGAAAAVLARLIDPTGASPALPSAEVSGLPGEWREAYDGALPSERDLLRDLAIAGVPLPTLGVESADGIPISISWPKQKIALGHGLVEEDIIELAEEGWVIAGPDAAEVVEALSLPRE